MEISDEMWEAIENINMYPEDGSYWDHLADACIDALINQGYIDKDFT